MNYDLTQGNIMTKLLKFAFPIMMGNVLQQLYNVVDTLIVGRFLGKDALIQHCGDAKKTERDQRIAECTHEISHKIVQSY